MDEATNLPEVMTAPEVAGFLRVNTKTVYGLIRRGELHAFRVGRVMRCHRPDVLRFVGNRGASRTQREECRS
jgi:excisionase family DNA binding protein